MAGILCDNGIQILNQFLCDIMVGEPVNVGLFTNNHTPTTSDTLATYTEASFGGYAQQPLTTHADLGTSGHIDTQQFNAVVFPVTGAPLPQTVYGYFLTVLGVLVGAEKFASSITVTTAGQAVVAVPTLSYQDRSIT